MNKSILSKSHQNILMNMLLSMIKIRQAEKKIALEKKLGTIIGPVHLGAGQEAIPVGISQNLRKTDRIFGAHRSHSHILALNSNIYKLFAEVQCKVTGFSKGMGGSMHLIDSTNGFYGSVPIVAGTVPIALGAALAAKMQKKDDIGVVYLGDGATEEGVFHESLNLAKNLNIPILFVVENNLFASHMHISLRQPEKLVSRFAIANKMTYQILDGNDALLIHKTSKKLINKIRKGSGPILLEMLTYRFYGHVDWREDLDVGLQRSKKDLESWKKRDPIEKLFKFMNTHSILDKKSYQNLIKEVNIEVLEAWNKALNDQNPKIDSIKKYVYSKF